MGLVQRAIEAEGIPTVGISILKEVTQKVRPPRSVFLRYPFGHPLGEAFNVAQQRTILLDALAGAGNHHRAGDHPGAGLSVAKAPF